MKTKSKIIIILLASISLLSFVYTIAPKDKFQQFLEKKLELFNKEKPREFVFLMLDKPFFKPGESIWFSAWITEGNYLKSTNISQKLYVELINPKGKVAKTLQLPIFSGRSNGDFELAETDAGGIYKIRAYTQYSKNFGDQHIFETELTVQKIVIPRLLMKLDFRKKAYGPGDLVEADFSVNTLENTPISSHSVKYNIYLNGEMQKKANVETDTEGKAIVSFNLPQDLNTNDGLLNIQLDYNGEKEAISRSIPIVLNNISLKFFPEGGKMIAGTACNVAFKALNEFGKPADIEAVLLDENNKEITSFASAYQGFGSFKFVADFTHQYKVKITKPVGVKLEYPLPSVEKNGYAIQIEERNDNALKMSWLSEKNDSVYLVASVRDIIYYSEKIPSDKGRNVKTFNTQDWPFGIAKISMFNNKQIVVSERLVYVGARTPMKLTIEHDKDSYQPGDSVHLKVVSKTIDNKPVKSKLAISVVDNKLYTFADDRQDNILSYLLMSNELKEAIEEPLYYFSADKEKAWNALDYVLMCSELKRLSWVEVINNKPVIRYFAERPDMISGRIVNRETREGVQSEVWLGENQYGSIESEGRTAHVTTTEGGFFTFFNVDPTATLFLFAKSDKVKSENLEIVTKSTLMNNETDFGEYVKDVKDEAIIEIIKPQQKVEKARDEKKKQDIKRAEGQEGIDDMAGGFVLENEDVGIDECVVVGYGMQRKANLTGSVTVINEEDLQQNANVFSALEGRVAGVQVLNFQPGAVDRTKIRIRGANALNDNANPLYVIDGVPVVVGQHQDIEPFSFVNLSDISSITVYKGADAQTIYGARGSNGVIVIETKHKRQINFNSIKKNIKSPYASTVIYPKVNTFSQRRRFDAQLQNAKNKGSRSNFRTTLFWEPLVETNENGEAHISFVNSDEVSSFKIIAQGISVEGAPGRGEAEYHTTLPVYIAAKMPAFVCFADTVKIPLMVTNNTEKSISGDLDVVVTSSFKAISEIPRKIEIKSGEKKVIMLSYFVENKAGKDELKINFNAGNYSDKVQKEFEVVPVGFPVLKSFSAQELEKEYEIEVADVLNGSLHMQLTAYPSVVDDIFAGVEGLLREPNGCFEQTSVSSYPNLLVMDYLKTTENKDKQLMKRANDLLNKGYSRLVSFETPTKGYEWFGGSPGHEALTAYGLMQFNDMKMVCNYVDNQMVERTAEWLLKARDGKGKFKRNSRALDSYGRAAEDITNAYIVYALSEAGYKNLKPEFEASYIDATGSKDPYMLALMANASLCVKEKTKAIALLTQLFEEQNKNGSWTGTRHSITYSTGNSLTVETTALGVLAMLKSENPNRESLNRAIDFLIKSRSGYGNFGSTQATILALKAITSYAKFSKRTEEAGTIELYIDGKKVAQTLYDKGTNHAIVMDGLEQFLTEGKHKIRVRYIGCKEALPYSLAVNWRTKTPQSSRKCQLALKCELQSNNLKVSDIVRLSTELKNKTSKGLPMSMIKIGIPGGLTPQPWQLKELRDKKIIDFYEIFDNYLVFYFRQMAPNEVKKINLDLKADMAGSYVGAASCAYLYYTDEDKDWQAGLKVKIEE